MPNNRCQNSHLPHGSLSSLGIPVRDLLAWDSGARLSTAGARGAVKIALGPEVRYNGHFRDESGAEAFADQMKQSRLTDRQQPGPPQGSFLKGGV